LVRAEGSMHTVGVDLAGRSERTALAVVAWTDGAATVVELKVGVTDADIVAAAHGAERIGIDAPFGWPDAFVELVTAHHAMHPTVGPAETPTDRRTLVRRRTDWVVHERTGIVPLSVSADLIGHVALRCAGILTLLAARGIDVDRADGSAVEAYPAAALRSWGLIHKGYKTSGTNAFAELTNAVLTAAPWLDLGRHAELFRTDNDAFDSVVAALVARAVAVSQVLIPDDADRVIAQREGWIQLPVGELGDLVSADCATETP